jgi:hypothetical protein
MNVARQNNAKFDWKTAIAAVAPAIAPRAAPMK